MFIFIAFYGFKYNSFKVYHINDNYVDCRENYYVDFVLVNIHINWVMKQPMSLPSLGQIYYRHIFYRDNLIQIEVVIRIQEIISSGRRGKGRLVGRSERRRSYYVNIKIMHKKKGLRKI